ncbi:hypothetical protein BVC93_04320 [Mycobacterium sp. MS1601]|nr:hypothetical protein BVC93_04320 [Mycobacterium sp. MS1601]
MLVLALLGGGLAVAAWLRDSPVSSARPEGMLPATYPTAPESAWTFNAEGAQHVATPVFGAAYYASPGAIVVGDSVIVHVALDSADKSAQLVSLSLVTGEQQWSKPVNLFDGCARGLLDGQLVCQRSDATGGARTIELREIHSGAVTSTVTMPFFVNMLATDGAYLYTGSYDETDGFVVTKGTVQDPLSEWRTVVRSGECAGLAGGDASGLEVRDGLVWGHQGGGAYAALRASDGSAIFGHDVTNVSVANIPFISAQRCSSTTDVDTWGTDVIDIDGSLLFTTTSRIQSHLLVVNGGAATPFLTVDGAGLDPETGEQTWQLPDWQSGSARTALVGGTLLSQGRQADVLSTASVESGDILWTQSPAGLGSDPVTDGVSLISENLGVVEARSIDDGTVLWATESLAATEGDSLVLYATDAGLLYVTRFEVGLFSPTGPAAAVPAYGSNLAEQDGEGTDVRMVTKCGTEPVFEPKLVEGQSGELVISTRVVAKCPGGDILSGSATRITVTNTQGQNVASAMFDLSKHPIVIPPDSSGGDPSVTHQFRFPAGTYWRIPVSLDEAPTNGASQRGRVDLDASTLLIDCEQGGADVDEIDATTGPDALSSTGFSPAPPEVGDPESASFDSLWAIARADRPFVASRLADRWVPQLSSKRPGLVADGITWSNSSTLREHLDLRARFPEVRLLWSGEWSTFSEGDWWITIAGVTFPDEVGALTWCRDNGLDRDHCYAKLVSTTHPIDGSTAFN